MLRPLSILILLGCLAGPVLASSAPPWVKSAAAAKIPNYESKVSSVVLLNQSATKVGSSGRAETEYRYVVRILSREGAPAARKDVHFDDETTIVKIRAWHIRPDGSVV